MKSKLTLAVVVAAILSFGFWNGQSKASSNSATSYEYQVLYEGPSTPNIKQLNEAGAQGWELVSITTNNNAQTILYLKRTRK